MCNQLATQTWPPLSLHMFAIPRILGRQESMIWRANILHFSFSEISITLPTLCFQPSKTITGQPLKSLRRRVDKSFDRNCVHRIFDLNKRRFPLYVDSCLLRSIMQAFTKLKSIVGIRDVEQWSELYCCTTPKEIICRVVNNRRRSVIHHCHQ